MSRWKAAGIHLLITCLVVGSLAALMLSTWYAKGMFEFADADRLLLVLACIDIVVGPLLTLIIFRAGKRGLKLDLTLIGLAQFAFLAYGLWVVWESRPVFLVAVQDRYELIFAKEVRPEDLEAADPRMGISRLPWFGPEIVGTKLPDDQVVRQRLIEELLQGRDLPVFPEFYVPLAEVAESILASSRPLDELPSNARQARYADEDDIVRWVHIVCSRGAAVVLIDAKTAEPRRIVPIDVAQP